MIVDTSLVYDGRIGHVSQDSSIDYTDTLGRVNKTSYHEHTPPSLRGTATIVECSELIMIYSSSTGPPSTLTPAQECVPARR